jgi:hypothetical protein
LAVICSPVMEGTPKSPESVEFAHDEDINLEFDVNYRHHNNQFDSVTASNMSATPSVPGDGAEELCAVATVRQLDSGASRNMTFVGPEHSDALVDPPPSVRYSRNHKRNLDPSKKTAPLKLTPTQESWLDISNDRLEALRTAHAIESQEYHGTLGCIAHLRASRMMEEAKAKFPQQDISDEEMEALRTAHAIEFQEYFNTLGNIERHRANRMMEEAKVKFQQQRHNEQQISKHGPSEFKKRGAQSESNVQIDPEFQDKAVTKAEFKVESKNLVRIQG